MTQDTPTREMFEAFQKMINPMAFPMQNLLLGGMKLEEVERRISELQTVHHWLSTNLGMLELSIKTLEYQRALLQPASASGASASSAAAGASAAEAASAAAQAMAQNPFLNPSLWPWPYGQTEAATGAAPADPATKAGAASPATGAARPGAAAASRDAAQAGARSRPSASSRSTGAGTAATAGTRKPRA